MDAEAVYEADREPTGKLSVVSQEEHLTLTLALIQYQRTNPSPDPKRRYSEGSESHAVALALKEDLVDHKVNYR